jgi:hypothetical protein
MIRKKESPREIVIDLTGPHGNVFFLMGAAKRLARQLECLYQDELDDARKFNQIMEETGIPLADEPLAETLGDRIVQEMMAGDYENAVQVFDNYFGSFVILER